MMQMKKLDIAGPGKGIPAQNELAALNP